MLLCYSVVVHGIESYINTHKIASEELFLGLPWYGFKYEFIADVKRATVAFDDDKSKTYLLD